MASNPANLSGVGLARNCERTGFLSLDRRVEDAVDEALGLGVAETGGQFKRFVDGDLGRDVSPVQHFENGETEQGQLDLAEPIHAPVRARSVR